MRIYFNQHAKTTPAILSAKRNELIGNLAGRPTTRGRLGRQLDIFNLRLDTLLTSAEKKEVLSQPEVEAQDAAYRQFNLATDHVNDLRKAGLQTGDEALAAAISEAERRKASLTFIVGENNKKRAKIKAELPPPMSKGEIDKEVVHCAAKLGKLVDRYNQNFKFDDFITIRAEDLSSAGTFIENYRKFVPTYHEMHELDDNPSGTNNSYYDYCFDRNGFSLHFHCKEFGKGFSLMTISRTGRTYSIEKSIKLERGDSKCVAIKGFFETKFPPKDTGRVFVDASAIDFDMHDKS